uniref:Uncharacterized protein n=1 Tax=Utricularia reniformis TaxID=192314 RepID=A0A1Y0AZQ1_9LAMI|nr:hypothetical protein AEK19_MT0336 [Utricularia reniformis]ART30608.1 hypothetical protein AEK19_MT0336 [Utricularia reniformis]
MENMARSIMHQYSKSNPRHLLPLYPGFISTQLRFLTMGRVRSSLVFDPYANHAVANIQNLIPNLHTYIRARIRSFEGRSKYARGKNKK